MPNEIAYVCLIDTTDVIGVLLTYETPAKKYFVHGFKNEAAGLDFFEKSYTRAHQRSHESSMSACLNNMFYRPSIIRLSTNTITALSQPKYSRGALSLSHRSGYMTVLEMHREKATKLWNIGVKPRLVSLEI